MIKKIGVLTSGGDAPGMNAAVRAAVRTAIVKGLSIYGIYHGFNGLIDGNIKQMTLSSVSDTIQHGGTILHSARSERFLTKEGQQQAVSTAKAHGLEGLIVIGGNGSLHGVRALHDLGLPVVGVPATIDNDLAGTESCIGFDTAVNTVITAMDKIRDTASAFERTFVIEVMGRDSGAIALAAGVAGGAEIIIVPEIPYDMNEIGKRLLEGLQRGKEHNLIVVAEGAGRAFDIAQEIRDRTQLEVRVTVLGYLQRGGTPTAFDRTLGSRLGARAVEALIGGESDVMVGWECGQVKVAPLAEVLDRGPGLDRSLYDLSCILAK